MRSGGSQGRERSPGPGLGRAGRSRLLSKGGDANSRNPVRDPFTSKVLWIRLSSHPGLTCQAEVSKEGLGLWIQILCGPGDLFRVT